VARTTGTKRTEEPAMNQSQARARVETRQRWLKAAERAVEAGIQVRQLQGTGQWIATSGTDPNAAYELQVTGAIAHGCDCLAGLNNDPICRHRAAFYLLVGAIDPTPEPDPPAPAGLRDCPACRGCGVFYDRELERLGLLYPACRACAGTGVVPAPEPLAA
jgi:hypothetical protein